MDTPLSVPPPARPLVAPVHVGGLKRFDSKRVLARLLDAALFLPLALTGVRESDNAYFGFLLLTLIYFFIAEATGAQTIGKRKLGLRVMQRDGSAPTVNQIGVRTVFRLIDDGPIGALVIVLSGERRQRIGDLLAGTTVGPAGASVPKPASSPLLALYPIGWLIGAALFLFTGSGASDDAEYAAALKRVACSRSAQADAITTSSAEMLQARYARYAAITPPESLQSTHAALLAYVREEIAIDREFAAWQLRGDRQGRKALNRHARVVSQHRQALVSAGIPLLC